MFSKFQDFLLVVVLFYSIYRIGFEDMKFGYAISQAMIVAVIIAVISITQIRFTDKKKIYD